MDSNHFKNLYLAELSLLLDWSTRLLFVFKGILFHCSLVGPSGLEPPTSCLSGTRSNLLSYEPMWLVSDFPSLERFFLLPFHYYLLLQLRGSFRFPQLCRHWAIFPRSLPRSIVTTAELNFRVRNGNGWTLCVCNTDCFPQEFLILENWTTNLTVSSLLGNLLVN